MRRPLIAGNWKMHGTQESAEQLLQAIVKKSADLNHVELAVFPPFVHLFHCQTFLANSSVRFGAQTCSEYPDGAYTGEISVAMLKDLGCHYVIIGHSERRHLLGETNAQMAQKCVAALNAGLTPILCVGETEAEREGGRTMTVVQEQLAVVRSLKDNCPAFTDIVIAYEPVWAIGTGKTATPVLAQEVHAFIRLQLDGLGIAEKTRILYGGSVKPDNAKALFEMPDINGALVGGCSLKADDFIRIAESYP